MPKPLVSDLSKNIYMLIYAIISTPLCIVFLPFIAVLIITSYSIAFLLYLSAAQKDIVDSKRLSKHLPHLPLHPSRVYKLNIAFYGFIYGLIFGPILPIAMKWVYKRLIKKRNNREVVVLYVYTYIEKPCSN